MGVDVEALKDEESAYVKALYVIKDASDIRFRAPLYRWDWVYNLTAAGRKHNKAIDFVHHFAYKVSW